jgi:hypothetical protein
MDWMSCVVANAKVIIFLSLLKLKDIKTVRGLPRLMFYFSDL